MDAFALPASDLFVLEVVLKGALEADQSGEARTGRYSLPDGRYKLAVDTGDGQAGRDKHKVFRVACDQGGPPPPDPTDPTGPVIVT